MEREAAEGQEVEPANGGGRASNTTVVNSPLPLELLLAQSDHVGKDRF